ncbi:MAG: signal peptidase I [Anaerolineae bacterium]|nr:signal peptidase I [Anaerolineae bacterium]
MKSVLRELIESVLPALVIVLVVNVFLAQATRVEGQSMEPNLHDNQRLIIEKITYHFRAPKRGDIVVLRRPNRATEPLIKRVVGLPGETVSIHEGRVYIDGEALDEEYLNQETWGTMPPRLVPEEHVFVLGDNRKASNDSRSFGMVPFDDIIGRAWLRYWPPNEIGPVIVE